MKHIAEAAAVSTATVSRVLNDPRRVSPSTVERVTAAMQELNYRPNHIARSLRRVSTQTLGVLVANVANPFFAELVRAIEDRTFETGLALILGNASEQGARQHLYLESFLEKQVDGMIMTPTGVDTDWVDALQARGMPLVFVDRTLAGVDVPTVTTDDDAAIGELIDHLIAQGHRSAAVITGPPANAPTRHRIASFVAAAEARGFQADREHIIAGGVSPRDGRRATRELLAVGGRRPDVLFTLNNAMAMGALKELSEVGLRIPHDIALAAYDDSPWFELLSPAVTAIAQPTTGLGRAAVDLVARMIRGEQVGSVRVQATFVPRDSTCRTAGPDGDG